MARRANALSLSPHRLNSFEPSLTLRLGTTVHTDNETSLVSSLLSEVKSRGLNLDLITPYTPEQNPFSGRYGALISSMSRQMVADAGPLSYLWHEAAKTSKVYIQNRIPIVSSTGSLQLKLLLPISAMTPLTSLTRGLTSQTSASLAIKLSSESKISQSYLS